MRLLYCLLNKQARHTANQHGQEQSHRHPHRHPVSLSGEPDVRRQQRRQRGGQHGVGGNVQVEIDKRVQPDRAQPDRAAQHERRAVAGLGREISGSALRVFPTLDNPGNHRSQHQPDQQHAGQSPVHQRVEIIVVHPHRSRLQPLRPILREAVIEMPRPDAQQLFLLPHIDRSAPQFNPRADVSRRARLVDVPQPVLCEV